MIKFNWFKWIVYLIIALLSLEVLKTIIAKIHFPAGYLIAVILISVQTLVISGFLYYLLFGGLFRKRQKTKKILLFFTTGFIGIIFCLEILFTYWLHHPGNIPVGLKWSYKYYYDAYNFRIIQYEKNLIAFDDTLLYTLKPGAEVNFRNAEFNTSIRINSDRFRDNDSSAVAPDIICLGDSFTMGWGVEESQTFPKILERKTGERVLNAGTPSYGTVRELLLLDRLDLSRIKYIIIQYCSNDIEENTSFASNNYKLKLTPLPEFKFAMRSYELSRKYFPGKNFLLIGQLWLKQQFNRIYPLFRFSGQPYSEEFDSRKQAVSFLNVLSKFQDKLKNTKIIVTNIDVYKYHQNEFINQLEQLIKETPGANEMGNIIPVNSIQDLTDKDYFKLDYHINVSGHEKVAEKLLEVINENPVNKD